MLIESNNIANGKAYEHHNKLGNLHKIMANLSKDINDIEGHNYHYNRAKRHFMAAKSSGEHLNNDDKLDAESENYVHVLDMLHKHHARAFPFS